MDFVSGLHTPMTVRFILAKVTRSEFEKEVIKRFSEGFYSPQDVECNTKVQ